MELTTSPTRWTAALALLTVLSTACGQPTCLSTCRRFYAPEPDGCGAAPDGLTTEDAIGQCTDICQAAIQIPGEPVDPNDRRFNPEVVAPLNETHALANEQEAAAWMDCVWTFDDETCPLKLDAQYCAKIF
jgi:hypothetical protein